MHPYIRLICELTRYVANSLVTQNHLCCGQTLTASGVQHRHHTRWQGQSCLRESLRLMQNVKQLQDHDDPLVEVPRLKFADFNSPLCPHANRDEDGPHHSVLTQASRAKLLSR